MFMRGDKMQKILVVGWKKSMCRNALYEMLEDHSTNLIIHKDKIVDLKDNTHYIIITNKMSDRRMFFMEDYSQVIYVDDFRCELFKPKYELHTWIAESLFRSCVPDDYKVICYEYPQATKEQKIDYYNRRFLTNI